MDWTKIPPPLITAGVGLVGVVVGSGISTWTTRRTHKERLAADQALSERKLELDQKLAERRFVQEVGVTEARIRADTALAEKRYALDRAFEAWKRNAEFAEETLADFYEARAIINSVRSPVVFAGEGSSREIGPSETEVETRALNLHYATVERLKSKDEFFAKLHARRYRFVASFGEAAGKPYDELLIVHRNIAVAAHMLLDTYEDRGDGDLKSTRIDWRKTAFWSGPNDPIPGKLDIIVREMEALCRPAILGSAP